MQKCNWFFRLLLTNGESSHSNEAHLEKHVLQPRHVPLLTSVTQTRDVVLNFAGERRHFTDVHLIESERKKLLQQEYQPK